jgi:hypothetical protein
MAQVRNLFHLQAPAWRVCLEATIVQRLPAAVDHLASSQFHTHIPAAALVAGRIMCHYKRE